MKNVSIHALYFQNKTWNKVHLFAHATKGIPGVEIIGLRSQGRLICEKINFLNKKFKIATPLYRYILCVDLDQYESKVDYRDLELPFLILYWSLAEVCPLSRLEKCLSSGRVDIEGRVFQNEKAFAGHTEETLLVGERISSRGKTLCLEGIEPFDHFCFYGKSQNKLPLKIISSIS